MRFLPFYFILTVLLSACEKGEYSDNNALPQTWKILETTKFTSGQIIDSGLIKIEYGQYRTHNRFYKVSSKNDTVGFYSFETKTDSIGKTFEIDGVPMNLVFFSWRDSLIIETKYGKEKIIKITTDSDGLSDATATTYYLSSGRPIIVCWNSWAKYFTYKNSEKDKAIITTIEKDKTGFFIFSKPVTPIPPPGL